MKTYNIYLSAEAYHSFDMFLKYMQMNCMYHDTWIFNEEEILISYNKHLKELVVNFEQELIHKLGNWIWWLMIKKVWEKIYYRKIIYIKHYIIVVYYSQNDKKKEIVVDTLTIKTR